MLAPLRLLSAAAALTGALFCVPALAAPPRLQVLLTPVATDGGLSRINVNMRLEAPRLEAGQALLRAPLVFFGTPMAGYTQKDIAARDAAGVLELTTVDETPTASSTFRRWVSSRATVGDVEVVYGSAPRLADAGTRNGPIVDLRLESRGASGAGAYFLAVPPGDEKRTVSLDWDLSKVPAHWRGVWSLGEGAQTQVVAPDTLVSSFYMVGPLSASTADRNARFGVYWLTEPPFKLDPVISEVTGLYDAMSAFFRDKQSTYRVFARANPYPSGGGTALTRSFHFSYGTGGETAGSKDLTLLIAHEMTHNWLIINSGGDVAQHDWYNEGGAEYYSLLLLLRSGNISLEKFEQVVNAHAASYATNPFRHLKSTDAAQMYWKDAVAQRVPYQRGFMYLAKVDAQIRATSGGKRSLDPIAVDLAERRLQGKRPGVREWLDLVVTELGESARQDFQDMLDAKPIVLPRHTFAPCFEMTNATTRGFELGFDEMSMGVVRDPRPGQAAAKAGLRDGDKILKFTPINDLSADPSRTMDIVVEREGRLLEFSYLPRGAEQPTVRWKRAQGAGSDCKI